MSKLSITLGFALINTLCASVSAQPVGPINFPDLASDRAPAPARFTASKTVGEVNDEVLLHARRHNAELNAARSSGGGTSSSSSGSSGGGRVFICSMICRGSLMAVGTKVDAYRVMGRDRDHAAENARSEAGKTLCKGGGKGDFTRAWWADVSSTSCRAE